MAIILKKDGKKRSLVEISNEHFEKLKKVTEDYEMKDELHTLTFLLNVAEQSKGKGLKVGTKTYLPPEDMK